MFVRPADAGQVDVPWPRVLVADGEAAGRQDLRQSLVQLGFDVVATVSAAPDAVEAALSLKPDVILLNVGFPGGFGALRSLRRYLPTTQVVAVGSADQAGMERARRAGAYSSIVRGCPVESVDDAIVEAWGAGRGQAYGPAGVRDGSQATRRVGATSSTSSKATASTASVRSPQPAHAHAATSISPEASTAA
ncbi:MAG TPA: response regulator [Actinomycetota bacterium]|nr:response regulator [Actinomycetota bacterium]